MKMSLFPLLEEVCCNKLSGNFSMTSKYSFLFVRLSAVTNSRLNFNSRGILTASLRIESLEEYSSKCNSQILIFSHKCVCCVAALNVFYIEFDHTAKHLIQSTLQARTGHIEESGKPRSALWLISFKFLYWRPFRLNFAPF